MKRVWSKQIDFQGHTDEDCWVDLSLHLLALASMYNINIIWYDVNEVMTYACILTNARGKEVDKKYIK